MPGWGSGVTDPGDGRHKQQRSISISGKHRSSGDGRTDKRGTEPWKGGNEGTRWTCTGEGPSLPRPLLLLLLPMRTDLNEPEAELEEGPRGLGVLVEAGSDPEGVWELEAPDLMATAGGKASGPRARSCLCR